MRLYKRGSTWWVDYLGAGGERVRESTRCTDRRAAELEGARRERDARDPNAAAIRDETLDRALGRLVARTKTDGTRRFYELKAAHLCGLLGHDTLLASLTSDALHRYVTERERAGVSEHTIHKEVRTLSTAMRLARRCGLYRGEIEAVIPSTRSGYTPRTRWLPLGEVVALLSSWHVSSSDKAARAALAVAVGAEWAALERAQREDLGDDWVRVRGTKSDKRDRRVPLVATWQRELVAFVREHARGPTPLLFAPTTHRLAATSLARACVRAGIEHASWHDLRRSTAQLLLRGGASYESLAAVLGHATTHVTQTVYARLEGDALAARLGAELGCVAGVPPGVPAMASVAGMPETPESNGVGKRGKLGGSSGTRTRSQRIKSPLLLIQLRSKSRGEHTSTSCTVTPVCRKRRA